LMRRTRAGICARSFTLGNGKRSADTVRVLQEATLRKRWVCLSLTIIVLACDPPTPPNAPADAPGPRPLPSAFGSLTIRPDTGASVVGRHLRVVITATDASGTAVDASSTEVTASNPSIAQLDGAIAIPATNPPSPHINALAATFDLLSAGSTAIHARLGIFS